MANTLFSIPKLHTGVFHWSAPGFPGITLSSGAMESVLSDAMEVFVRLPRHGAETGGLLLGRKDAQGIVIDDFAPVPSEHRFGRLYRLSDADRANLRQACEAVRPAGAGSEVVGFYRSHARDKPGATEEDAEYLVEHLAEDRRVLLIINPGLSRRSTASFFFWREGRMEEPADPEQFPFRAAAAMTAAAMEMPAAEHSEPLAETLDIRSAPTPPPRMSPPFLPPVAQSVPPRLPRPAPRATARLEDDRSGRVGSFAWALAATLLAGSVAVTAGYIYRQRSIDREANLAASTSVPEPVAQPELRLPSQPLPQPPPALPPLTQPPPAQPATPTDPPPTVESPVSPTPAGTSENISKVLNGWAAAIRRGRLGAAGEFYSPAARPAAIAGIREQLGSARRMDIFRISDTVISYPAPGEAVATFRQRWQAGRTQKSAGEQRLRLALRANGDKWQIVSQRVEQVYWSQKVR